jgi:hypothetical protein
MHDNPFAPPSARTGLHDQRALVFSGEGAAVVASLATWMRGMSIVLYVVLAGLALGSCAGLATGTPEGFGMTIAFVVIGALIAAAATWLRRAAHGFEQGVLSDDEITIGEGFRNLRAYLVLVGIGSILSMLSTLLDVVG